MSYASKLEVIGDQKTSNLLCTTSNFLPNTMVIIVEMVIVVEKVIMVKMLIMVEVVIMVKMNNT